MQIQLDPEDLKPIIETVVADVIERFDTGEQRLAFSEEEAAAMLGVNSTTLRDERLRGRVEASTVGRKIRYTRQNLLDYLARRRWQNNGKG